MKCNILLNSMTVLEITIPSLDLCNSTVYTLFNKELGKIISTLKQRQSHEVSSGSAMQVGKGGVEV